MASSEHFEYFINFLLAEISLLLIGFIVLGQVIANSLAYTSKTERGGLYRGVRHAVREEKNGESRINSYRRFPWLY